MILESPKGQGAITRMVTVTYDRQFIHGAVLELGNSEESVFRVLMELKPKNKGTRVYMNGLSLTCDNSM